jgi:2-oxoglutarate dehydrogenase E1 component
MIGEIDEISPDKVERLVFCCGKVYYDLLEARRERGLDNVAIVRIEQLYPFPEARYLEELGRYPQVKTIIWCQDEPRNQGAWYQIQHHLNAPLGNKQSVQYAGRPASASPAVGYHSVHVEQQQALVNEALGQ